jgi:hypothetical protein
MNKHLVIRMKKRLGKTQIKGNKHQNALNKTILKRTKIFLFELNRPNENSHVQSSNI